VGAEPGDAPQPTPATDVDWLRALGRPYLPKASAIMPSALSASIPAISTFSCLVIIGLAEAPGTGYSMALPEYSFMNHSIETGRFSDPTDTRAHGQRRRG
jgi:hypothetical protein